jgi:hypothetical protein
MGMALSIFKSSHIYKRKSIRGPFSDASIPMYSNTMFEFEVPTIQHEGNFLVMQMTSYPLIIDETEIK